jgi:hypothetical protein
MSNSCSTKTSICVFSSFHREIGTKITRYLTVGSLSGRLCVRLIKVRTLMVCPMSQVEPSNLASSSTSSYARPPPSVARMRDMSVGVIRYATPITSGISRAIEWQDLLIDPCAGSRYGTPGTSKQSTNPGMVTTAVSNGCIPLRPRKTEEHIFEP